MSQQDIEVEPTKGCRVCGQTDGSDTLTAYILCLRHRQAVIADTALLEACREALALYHDEYLALPAENGVEFAMERIASVNAVLAQLDERLEAK